MMNDPKIHIATYGFIGALKRLDIIENTRYDSYSMVYPDRLGNQISHWYRERYMMETLLRQKAWEAR
jgi:hypothetical protein